MAESESPDALRDDLRMAWHRYVDLTAPLRPALHGYCRRLARNVWDAEDLVQDTLLRAFGHLGFVNHEIANPRGYLLRTATNVWIDEQRRRASEARAMAKRADEPKPAPAPETASDVRAASERLLQRLSPQERAAVLLKESFDMSLEEIAALLATSIGAVKAALHRGRDRLREPEGQAASRRPLPSAGLVDRFLERLNARDLPGLAALLLDGAAVENVGESLQFGGREIAVRRERNTLWHMIHGHDEWPAAIQPTTRRFQRIEFEGEPMLGAFVSRGGRESLMTVYRFEEQDGRISRLRTYAFCPETMREVGQALGVRVWTGLYRAPTPAPGRYWPPSGSGA
jgi:RNA polymerase sigma-70 factor (ECF subfamily)